VVDRLIQQALLQVLQARLDPSFSAHSHGFRPGHSAHGAVLQAKQYVCDGYTIVVDVDLEKFFDRVNHDILMDRLAKRVGDKRVLRLIRRYLEAGVMAHGLVSPRTEGTPQGGPLSPLLANVLLDEVDRQLEQRGHRFVRYADDCNVYVKSQRAGERVLRWLRRCYAKLALKVNESKTAVGDAWERKFLGYRLFCNSQGEVKLGVSAQAMTRLKQRLRDLTRTTQGRSLEQVAQDLRTYVPGWKAYFQLVQTVTDLRQLDSWLRYRLRVVRLRQWRYGPTIYRELRKLDASDALAARTAANSRGWWRTAREGLNRLLPNAYFDALGVPKFS
jgi:group II intron reverse transcriptase/maturase